VRSAIYEGTVVHHRHEPVEHRFSYPIALPLIFLDEVDELCRIHPLWSTHPSPVWLRRADLPGAPPQTPDQAVRDLVEHRLGVRPRGPVAVLAQPRTWGWLFNPLSISFCFSEGGERIDAHVLEVRNTPWHERHTYVLDGGARHQFAKAMHVSPFMGMDQTYHLSVHGPGETLTVALANHEEGRRVFDARMALERRELTRSSLGRVLWAYPFQTMKVSARIYRQALALHRKGAPFHGHPRGLEPASTTRGGHG
jgi:DUF1365 family protein